MASLIIIITFVCLLFDLKMGFREARHWLTTLAFLLSHFFILPRNQTKNVLVLLLLLRFLIIDSMNSQVFFSSKLELAGFMQ
jgi:hypothetical protein